MIIKHPADARKWQDRLIFWKEDNSEAEERPKPAGIEQSR
jgi:hypothetical protein